MKPTAYLINTARSVLIDTKSFYNALLNKKIMGAAIDVFESEPIIPDFYKNFSNITITNHRGGDTINSYKDAPSFANNFAIVVFPVPLGPQNRYACAILLLAKAFFKVRTICCCPATSSKV